MSQLTKIQLESENQSSFPNNTSNFITPQALREFNTDMIQSTVNQTIYTADSASFSQRITQNQGVQGIQGVQGSQGIQGIQGSQGIQGVQGSDATVQGIQGSTGIQGIQGLQGLQGIQGLRGTQGTTGAQGYTGNTGNVGSTGAQGAQGLSGNNAGQGTTGAQGQQGTQGAIGSQGTTGAGTQGAQGSTGAGTQGATGIQGAQGIQGIQGLQGVTQYTGSFAITGSNTFFGEQTIVGNVTFPSGSFISSNNVSGNLYFSALNNGILHLNDDGGEGDVIIGYVGSAGKLKVKTDTEITGSLFVSGNVYANNLTGSVIDSGSFATTGSNTFTGNQTISQSKSIILGNSGSIKSFSNGSIEFQSTAGLSIVNKISGEIDISQYGVSTARFFHRGGGAIEISGSSTYISDVNFIPFSASLNTRILAIDTGSFATTGSNTFTGNQTIEGAIVSNITSSVIKLFSAGFVSGAVQLNITSSAAISQSNLVLAGVPLLASSTSTGSIIISGSNNILLTPARTNTLLTAGTFGYIGGGSNILATIPTLNTASLFSPGMSNNNINSAITFTFTTSPVSTPTWNNNLNFNSVTINHPSGTLTAQNNITNQILTSTANINTLTAAPTINGNTIIGGALALNHNSSSITYQQNIGGGITVTNNYTSSAANNINVTNNLFIGASNVLIVTGSNSATTRAFNSNFIAGRSNIISSSVSASSFTGGHLVSTALIGHNLVVSASHTSTTVGGTTYVGRFNDITSGLNDSQNVIFAVGGGTSDTTRKTPLYITTGSAVFVSGSLSVTGSLAVSGTINTITISSAGDVSASAFTATGGNTKAFSYLGASSGGVNNTFNTALGRDYLDIYQYQGQAYAFNMHLTSDQLNTYSGSQFAFQLQTNGSGVSIPGGGATYFSMVSASYSSSVGPGTAIPGLDVLGASLFLDMKAPATFEQKVYMNKGLYVSSSAGSSGPALTINTNGGTALTATGSVIITGSLSVNGNNISSLAAGAFYSTQTQSGSAAVSQSMTFNNTSINENVNVNSNTQLTVTNSGTYNIQFSAQLLADTGADTIYIWLKKNGSNVSNTATKLVLANNESNVAAWNFVENAGAGDYFELCWQSANGDAVLLYENSSGNVPAIPSVIATVTQVN